MPERFLKYCLLLAGFCFVVPAINIAIQEILWLLNVKALLWGGIISLLIALALLFFQFKNQLKVNEFLSVLLVFVLLFSVSLVVAQYYYDSTRDGLAYHQEAIIQMKNGWNPVKANLSDEVPYAFFINHYPKASWINSATIFAMTGKIESGKLFNILYTAGTFLLVFYLLIVLNLPVFIALAGSMLATLNSVTIVQLQSNMVDQINANMMTALVACLLLTVMLSQNRIFIYLVILSLLVIFDTKFTSIVNAVVFLFFYNVLVLAFNKQRFKESFLFTLVAGVIYVSTSINPYVTNVIDGKHPLYPTMGKESMNVIEGQVPFNYVGQSQFINFFNSVFSASEDDITPSKLKLPGTLTWKEFSIFSSMADTRKGGFGSTFSLLCIVALILFIITMFLSRDKSRYVAACISLALIVSVLINPANWWARIVPQLWIVPVIWLLACILYAPKRYVKIASTVMIVALLIQGFYFASYLWYENTKAVLVNRQLKELKESHKNILVDFGPCASVRERLIEHGILFTPVKMEHRSTEKNKLENSTAVFRYSNE